MANIIIPIGQTSKLYLLIEKFKKASKDLQQGNGKTGI